MASEACPICELPAENLGQLPYKDAFAFQCRRCGKFAMEGLLVTNFHARALSPEELELRRYLSAYTRQASEAGSPVTLDQENWKDYARVRRATPVPRKTMKLLELLASRSAHPGADAPLEMETDYPLIDAGSENELLFFLQHLADLGYISAPLTAGIGSATLTVQGWERLEPAARGEIPDRCFVAMAFDDSLNDAFENGIRAAAEDCGFQAIKMDLVNHNEKICDKILAEVLRARFLIADFSFHRHGVYFEAGFAMGLGRPVIWCCRKDEFEKTHFDTRQYNHILWSTPEELREKLTDRIRATILNQTTP